MQQTNLNSLYNKFAFLWNSSFSNTKGVFPSCDVTYAMCKVQDLYSFYSAVAKHICQYICSNSLRNGFDDN